MTDQIVWKVLIALMTDLSAGRSISLTRLLTMRSQPIVLTLFCLAVVVAVIVVVVIVDVVFVIVLDIDVVVKATFKGPCHLIKTFDISKILFP